MDSHRTPWNDQHAVIVGGNSGMGLALAERLLIDGAAVTLVGRSLEKLESARAHLASVGRARIERADVTHEHEVLSLFDRIGPVDHLVCTAADIRGSYVLLPELPMDALQRALQSKVVAPMLLAKHVLPRLSARGSITFTSGIAAYRPRPRGVVVAAINAALEGMVRAMAVEFAPVRVNAVSPGWVHTPIWQDVAGQDARRMLDEMAARLPVGRVGQPEDIADAIAFLMGNGFTTGTVLHVEGGHRLV